MWFKVTVPSGVGTISGGYVPSSMIANFDVRNPEGSDWYVFGTLPNSYAIGEITTVYLDPAYSSQADAEAALIQLVNMLGQLGN